MLLERMFRLETSRFYSVANIKWANNRRTIPTQPVLFVPVCYGPDKPGTTLFSWCHIRKTFQVFHPACATVLGGVVHLWLDLFNAGFQGLTHLLRLISAQELLVLNPSALTGC